MAQAGMNRNKLPSVTELSVEQLRFYCQKGCLDFETTATIAPLEGMIDQSFCRHQRREFIAGQQLRRSR